MIREVVTRTLCSGIDVFNYFVYCYSVPGKLGVVKASIAIINILYFFANNHFCTFVYHDDFVELGGLDG